MQTLGWTTWIRGMAVFLLAGYLTGCEDNGGGGGGDLGDVGSNNPDVYAALGDSTVYGNNGGGAPFPPRLASMTGKTVLNYGTDNESTGSALARLGGILANDKPAAILVYVGAVDLIHGVSPDAAAANIRSMIQQARANQTVALVATLLPMSGSHAAWAEGARQLSARIRDAAAAEGARLVDLEGEFGSGDGLMLSDGLHPNDAGNQLMAEAFADAL